MTCIRYAAGYKYQLRANYACRLPELQNLSRPPIATGWIELDPDGTLRISAGYAWDGASGPTFDSRSSMRASLGHDALYQLIRLGLLPKALRAAADAVFKRQCREDGMWGWRAALWFHAVRLFADPATDPAAESPDECAPCDCGGAAVVPAYGHPEAP